MEEEQTHLDAFELYFKFRQEGLKVKESIERVAVEQNLGKSTLWKWKKNFNWDDKEAVRSAEINQEVQKQTNSTIIDNKTRYLSFLHKLLDKVLVKDKDGNVIDITLNIENINDLKKVIDTSLLLQGEPTEKIESEHKGKLDVSIHDRIKKYQGYYNDIDTKPEGNNNSDDP